MNFTETLGVVGLAVLMILLVVIGPIVTIWAWNTLFGSLLNIPTTFDTWLAVAILGMFFSGSSFNHRSKK